MGCKSVGYKKKGKRNKKMVPLIKNSPQPDGILEDSNMDINDLVMPKGDGFVRPCYIECLDSGVVRDKFDETS